LDYVSNYHSLSIQLQRIKDLHSVGYVHGDIKPCNLLIGKPKTITSTAVAYKVRCGVNQKFSETALNFNNSRSLFKNTNTTQNCFNPNNEQILYLIDFGISTKYVDEEGRLLP
jgi:serine/threonine protein kinase